MTTRNYFDWIVIDAYGNDHSVSGVLFTHAFEDEIVIRGTNGEINFWALKTNVKAIFRDGQLTQESLNETDAGSVLIDTGRCDDNSCGCV